MVRSVTCLELVYCELTRERFVLKNCLEVSRWLSAAATSSLRSYPVKPITCGSSALFCATERMTSVSSGTVMTSCGFMWNVSVGKREVRDDSRRNL